MSRRTTTVITCDECGGRIETIECDLGHALYQGSSPTAKHWWSVSFAEARDGKWQAELCSKRCLSNWVEGWRAKPDLKVVE